MIEKWHKVKKKKIIMLPFLVPFSTSSQSDGGCRLSPRAFRTVSEGVGAVKIVNCDENI